MPVLISLLLTYLFKYTLQNCTSAVSYADTYDETMKKNYKQVSYSVCTSYKWMIQKTEVSKLSVWDEHTSSAVAALSGSRRQWNVKAP